MKNKPYSDLVNEKIPFAELLVIDSDGTQLNVMSKAQALALAQERELDLFVVAPNANPPVCKILDYGRYKYEMQKKEKENKKKQNIIRTREMRLSIDIGTNDLEFKAKKVIEFLRHGDRVKLSLRFRGREIIRKEAGYQTLMRFYDLVKDYGTIENEPKLIERIYNMYIVAKKREK